LIKYQGLKSLPFYNIRHVKFITTSEVHEVIAGDTFSENKEFARVSAPWFESFIELGA
jgi:hypothetical protein